MVEGIGSLSKGQVVWTVGVPSILVMLFAFFSEYDVSLYRTAFDGELGIVENLQVLFLIMGICSCLKFLKDAGDSVQRRVKSYCWLFLAALIFVVGEEISWGQVYFNWNTPHWYVSVNKQGETNLHNSSSWLNFKPRIVVQFMIIFFGITGPFILHGMSQLASWKRSIMPDMISFYCALLCFALKVLTLVGDALDVSVFGFRNMRFSEVQELLFYFFFLSYAYSIYLRHKKMNRTDFLHK